MSNGESIFTLKDAIVDLDEGLAEKTTEELMAMDFDARAENDPRNGTPPWGS